MQDARDAYDAHEMWCNRVPMLGGGGASSLLGI